MQVEPSLGGEDGWKRWGTEAEARPSYLYHQGPCCPLVACLDISLAALVNIASQSPGSWQAHGRGLAAALLISAAFGLTGFGPLLPCGHSPPLLCCRLPPAVPHPHSRQCRPAPAHTLVLPTLHLRTGCAGEPSILQSLPLSPPLTGKQVAHKTWALEADSTAASYQLYVPGQVP